MLGLGECPRLFSSYSQDRFMHVDTNDAISDNAILTRGVPQGSVIAPLLFNIYYLDVISSFNSNDIVLYADDTAIISTASSLSETMVSLSQSAARMESYLESKKMCLNANKSFYMLFNTSSSIERNSLTVSNGKIANTSSFKYLGVWFDEDLSFEIHCAKLIAKGKSKLYMLLRYPRYRHWRERRLLFLPIFIPNFYLVLNATYIVVSDYGIGWNIYIINVVVLF
jgi:hypothetical protein